MIVVALSVSCFFFSDKRDVDREITNRKIETRENIEESQFA